MWAIVRTIRMLLEQVGNQKKKFQDFRRKWGYIFALWVTIRRYKLLDS